MSGHMYRLTCTMFATRLTQPGRGSQRRPLQRRHNSANALSVERRRLQQQA
jgi:hypothetical protein